MRLHEIAETSVHGPTVKWYQWPERSASANPDVPHGYRGMLWAGETFVLQVSRPFRYAQAASQIEQLTRIEKNWDGHGGAPVSRDAADQAIAFLSELDRLYEGAVPPPMVGPLSDGAVAFVWQTSDTEVEIIFGDAVEYAVSDRQGRRPLEFEEGVRPEHLLSTIVPRYLLS